MFVQSLVCFFAMSAIIGCSSGAEYMETKPDFIKTCQRKTPDEVFVPCATESMRLLFKKLATGIDGIDARLDRIHLKKIKIFSSDGPVSLDTSLSNAEITGFNDAIIVRSYVDPDKYSWDSHIRVPKMRLEGEYEMDGRILLLPLQGKGKCWIEPYNLDVVVNTKLKLYEKFGHIFYNITEAKIDFNMTGMKLRLDNLFNGIQLLEDSANTFLNDNWKPVSDAFKPLIQPTIADIVLELFDKVFSYIPAEYFVSDVPHPEELYKKSQNE